MPGLACRQRKPDPPRHRPPESGPPAERGVPPGPEPSRLDPIEVREAGRWRDPDSNRGHHDFQSCALPAELSRRRGAILAIVLAPIRGPGLAIGGAVQTGTVAWRRDPGSCRPTAAAGRWRVLGPFTSRIGR